jgi:uncharacterized protein (DUF4415 family)
MSNKIAKFLKEPVDDLTEENVDEEFRFDLAKARMNVLPRGVRKVRVNIWLDDDVVTEFKARAEQPNAAPYQTQINQTLREALGKNVQTSKQKNLPVPVIDNPQFIQQLSEKIGEYLIAHTSKTKPKRKAA